MLILWIPIYLMLMVVIMTASRSSQPMAKTQLTLKNFSGVPERLFHPYTQELLEPNAMAIKALKKVRKLGQYAEYCDRGAALLRTIIILEGGYIHQGGRPGADKIVVSQDLLNLLEAQKKSVLEQEAVVRQTPEYQAYLKTREQH